MKVIMNIDDIRSEVARLEFINKSPDDLKELVIQKLKTKNSRNILNHYLNILRTLHKHTKFQRTKHQLLSENRTNKLKWGDLISGGISLFIFSILIIIGANFSINVAILLISIFLAGTIFDDFRDNEVSCRNISN